MNETTLLHIMTRMNICKGQEPIKKILEKIWWWCCDRTDGYRWPSSVKSKLERTIISKCFTYLAP